MKETCLLGQTGVYVRPILALCLVFDTPAIKKQSHLQVSTKLHELFHPLKLLSSDVACDTCDTKAAP